MLFIAEVGQNFLGNLQTAKDLIYASKSAGADIVKFQLYDSKKLYGEYQSTEVDKETAIALVDYARKVNIEIMFSVFDNERVDWCEEFGVKRYKLACGWIYKDIYKKVKETGKPIIASSVLTKHFPYQNVDYLYCVPEYPADFSLFNLSKVNFKRYAGISDHSIGTEVCLAAVARGANIIEKHITQNKDAAGPDHKLSITPPELRKLIESSKRIKEAL